MKKKLGDVLLGLLRERGGQGGGGAHRRRPSLVLHRSPARVGWIWWESVSSSSMTWLGKSKEEERSVLWGKRGNGEGRGAGGGGTSVGLDEDMWHIFSTQATRTHGPLADRPR